MPVHRRGIQGGRPAPARRGRGLWPPTHHGGRPKEDRPAGKSLSAATRVCGSSGPGRGWLCGSPGLPGGWRCSWSSLPWIEPRHRRQVTSCHPRTTRGRCRLEVRRWPQAVCSRSVSHRWMGCGIVDLLASVRGSRGRPSPRPSRHQTAVIWAQVVPSGVSHADRGRQGTAAHAAAPPSRRCGLQRRPVRRSVGLLPSAGRNIAA
jgi:hypothetical protein